MSEGDKLKETATAYSVDPKKVEIEALAEAIYQARVQSAAKRLWKIKLSQDNDYLNRHVRSHFGESAINFQKKVTNNIEEFCASTWRGEESSRRQLVQEF